MSDSKIDYGKLAGKVAHDAGGFARKGIGLIAGAIKPENIRKGVSAVRSVADAAVQGWEDAGAEVKTTTETSVPDNEAKTDEPADSTPGTSETNEANDSDGVHIESVTETPTGNPTE